MMDYIGKVCVCSIGRLGLVTGKTIAPWGETYYGAGLDGHGLWMSRKPVVVIAESIEEYADRLLSLSHVKKEDE